ncbi:MAG: hypothetical protein LBU85_04010 [Treponema sp.]|jgi:flagellar basal body-associated protein FliL|nr:hypothetical protein [Treponema sp.]
MKREIDVPGNKMLVFYRIIVVLMLFLVALLIAGSLYAFLRSRDSGPLIRIGSAVENGGGTERAGKGGSHAGQTGGVYSVFSGMRIQNSGKLQAGQQQTQPAVIVISISFPYNAGDRPFTEELASKIEDFRAITVNYFAGLPRDSLSRLDEEQIKAEILGQYNALLRLGKIETLYFSDLMIVE